MQKLAVAVIGRVLRDLVYHNPDKRLKTRAAYIKGHAHAFLYSPAYQSDLKYWCHMGNMHLSYVRMLGDSLINKRRITLKGIEASLQDPDAQAPVPAPNTMKQAG
jgi:hypothetical protein